MPNHLMDAYENARQDPRLLSMREDIALADAMIAGLLQQLDDEPKPAKDRRIWRQVMKQIDLKRRLVVSEVRHMVLAEQMIPAEDALALVAGIVEIVNKYVPDPKDRQAIGEEVRTMISKNSRFGGPHA